MRRRIDPALVAELAAELTGTVLDRTPALIVRARSTHDVVTALTFAHRAGLEVSARSANRATRTGGVTIDLAEMRTIGIDPIGATALAEAGVVWGELDAAAGRHGLAVTGGVLSTMGIAGSTLGGGPGWLMAKHGLAADNLMSALLVTAEGDVLCADASSHPDLFWALRGGGGNFGIVTSLTYRLHPIDVVVGGVIAHPVDAASQLLRFYREAIADASDDLTVLAALMHAPDGSGRKLAAFVVFHAGDAVTADRELAPFKAWGSPLLVDVASIPYPVMNKILDASFPPDALGQCRSRLRRGLTDELIETAVQRFRLAPSQMSAILLEHRHGAVTRVAPTATAVPERQEGWNLLIPTVPGPANVAWARETFAALRPNLDSGRYGLNYARLQDVKRRYDPENVFRVGHNIAP